MKFGVDVKYLSKINDFNKFKKLKNGQMIKLKDIHDEISPEKTSFVNNNSKDSRFIFEEALTPMKE